MGGFLMSMESNLIVKKIFLERDKIVSFDRYPFNIDIVKNFDELNFDSQVTFFVGENGVGKSTFIEAIAVALGLPAEGGTENFRYETRNTTSELSNYLNVWTYNKPKMKFFLRAESFYNFSSEVQRLVEEDEYFDDISEKNITYDNNAKSCFMLDLANMPNLDIESKEYIRNNLLVGKKKLVKN